MNKLQIAIDKQDLNTILAALRFYQEGGQGDPSNRSDAIHEIATDGDETSMDDEGIDELCERLNCDSVETGSLEIICHDGVAHTNKAITNPDRRTGLNWCARCKDWFYPVSELLTREEAKLVNHNERG